jgi:hypothetical protein
LSSVKDIEERINFICELKDTGLLTSKEFQNKKKELVSRI